ncbi:hypothetical protein PMKS-004066 [Pichia membranifaciens]|uniref:Uncharacterized protein n=1 Tax=Pichia membranifaciens TaxID=4926 RepID=A0A1Q2YLX7_9ASCO|nr:hypothetical protein PMKS-004066 [Pichia membranifaciens]
MQYTFGQMNDTDEFMQAHHIHHFPQNPTQQMETYILPAQQLQNNELDLHIATPGPCTPMRYQHKPNTFHNGVCKPQHQRRDLSRQESPSVSSIQAFEDVYRSKNTENVTHKNVFCNENPNNSIQKQHKEINSQNHQRNPYSYQNVKKDETSDFGYKLNHSDMNHLVGTSNPKLVDDLAFLNSFNYGTLDNKVSYDYTNTKEKNMLDTATANMGMNPPTADFHLYQVHSFERAPTNEDVYYVNPFSIEQQNEPTPRSVPEARDSISQVNNEQVDYGIMHHLNAIYDPEQYRGRNYDLRIAETLIDRCPPLQIYEQKAAASTKLFESGNTEADIESLKTFVGNNGIDTDIKYIISRLNTTQLQKFSETKYFSALGSLNPAELTLQKVMNGVGCRDLQADKEELFEAWNSAKSSHTTYYCSCKRFIWQKPTPETCPFDEKHFNSSEHQNLTHCATKIPSPIIHTKVPFSIELFNNHILSILLNKKLRTYLKKTIRPSKTMKEKCSYMSLLQDGKIYRDTIEAHLNKIDFAFTLTMITPKIKGSGPNSRELSAVYFVFNELPIYLRYKPEFMFLACACDANDDEEWNKKLLTPLFAYLNYLKENTIRVSLNRHEYHVKIAMSMALTNGLSENSCLLDIAPLSPAYPCLYCTAPYCILSDKSGTEYRSVYSSKRYPEYNVNNYISDDKALVSLNAKTREWPLRKNFFLDPLKYFNYNRCLLVDAEKWILEGLFQSIAGLIKHLFRFGSSDILYDLFKQNLVQTHQSLVQNNVLENPNALLQLIDPESEKISFDSISDLKILQALFPHLFCIYFSDMFETPKKLRYALPTKLKILSLLIELNAYIGALFSSEIVRDKIPHLREGLRDLLREIEHLSRFDLFKNLNSILSLPLHYMFHLYEKWEDVGDYTAISTCYMGQAIKNFQELSNNNCVDQIILQDRIKCLNIYNCMKIYKHTVPEYPAYQFIDSKEIAIRDLHARSKIKHEEFAKRFLFDALDSITFDQCTTVDEIQSFELNSVIIKPEAKSTTSNLVRIKGTKRSAGWRLVHIYGMKRVKYIDSFTRERMEKVFIEYKETRSIKKYQKTSESRPTFLLEEILMLKSSGKDLRCVWLDDIHMVALKVITDSHLVYDPNTLIKRVFDT